MSDGHCQPVLEMVLCEHKNDGPRSPEDIETKASAKVRPVSMRRDDLWR